MPDNKIRVALIDDCPLSREAFECEINRCPGLDCVATFSELPPALETIPGLNLDVLLVDLALPGGPDGIEITQLLVRRYPLLKVVILTMHEVQSKVLEAFSAGAHGYILKTAPRDRLARAITRVHEGGYALSERVCDAVVDFLRRRVCLLEPLSPTEHRIMERLSSGTSYKELADEMGISMNTLKTHTRRILQKTGVHSMTAAAHLRRSVV